MNDRWEPNDAFRFLDGEMTPDETRAFVADIGAGGSAARYLADAKAVRSWTASVREATLDELSEAAPVDRGLFEPAAGLRPFALALGKWVPAAAFAAVAAMVAVVWYTTRVPPEAAGNPTPAETVAAASSNASAGAVEEAETTAANGFARPTDADRVKTAAAPDLKGAHRMADGSTIRAESAAIWRAKTNEKNAIHVVVDAGAIEVSVPKSSTRTDYVVQSGDFRVRVIGTEFTVRRTGPLTTVSVTEGIVAVDGPGTRSRLTAGDVQEFRSRALPNPETARVEPRPNESSARVDAATPKRVRNSTAKPPGSAAKAEALTGAAAEASPKDQPLVAQRVAAPQESVSDIAKRILAEERSDLRANGNRKPTTDRGEDSPTALADPGVEVITSSPEAREALLSVLRLIKKGQHRRALDRLTDFGKDHPKDRLMGHAVYLEGYCWHALGQRDEALSAFQMYDSRYRGGPWLTRVGDWTNPPLPRPDQVR